MIMLHLRNIWRVVTPSARQFTTSRYRQSAEITMDDQTGIATVSLNKAPVNSLSLELLRDINITLDKLHAEGCKGMIFGSRVPNIFCAGLDITEMYQPDPARIKEFWRTLQDTFLKLYSSPMVTMASITGHSPAGGCLLAMCCDYRVMAEGKFSIGLNEALLGIAAPFWFKDAMINTIGHRQTELGLPLGKLYSSKEALSIGLVDAIVPLEDVHATVLEQLTQWLKIPGHARQLMKLQIRQPTIDKLLTQREEDIESFAKFIQLESIQRSLGMYLEALKKKAQKKDK